MRADVFRRGGRTEDAAAEERLADVVAARGSHDLFMAAEEARMLSNEPLASPGESSSGSLQRAVDGYQAALEQDAGNYWARVQMARCYLALRRGPEAVEALGACIALRPQSPWAYSARGLAFALLRRFEAAKRDFDRALELDPDCVAARLNRGVMFQLQERPELAAAEFDALLARADPPVEAAFYRAQLFLLADEPAKALATVTAVPDRHRPQQLAHLAMLRAEALLRLGRPDDALQELQGLAHVDSAAQRGHALRLLAARLPRKQQPMALELAARQLSQAAAQGEPAPTVFADLGAVLHLQGHNDLAIPALGRAIVASRDDPRPLINRGWARVATDDLPAADADFTAARALAPRDAEALSGLGYVSARRGRAIDAQRHASLALLHGGNDYRILHNIACVYAQLSLTDSERATEHQDAAIDLLRRAVRTWRSGWGGPDELELIRFEVAFPPSMRTREDFRKLLAGPAKEVDGDGS